MTTTISPMPNRPKDRYTPAQAARWRTKLARSAAAHRQAENELWQTVADAHQAGLSWKDIGDVLAVSPQAAHERFTKPPRRRPQ